MHSADLGVVLYLSGERSVPNLHSSQTLVPPFEAYSVLQDLWLRNSDLDVAGNFDRFGLTRWVHNSLPATVLAGRTFLSGG